MQRPTVGPTAYSVRLRVGLRRFIAKPVHLNVVRNLWQHCMIKDRTLFDDLDEPPRAASIPSSPAQSVVTSSAACSSVPAVCGAPVAIDAGGSARTAQLAAQLERLALPTYATSREVDDLDPGACQQQ